MSLPCRIPKGPPVPRLSLRYAAVWLMCSACGLTSALAADPAPTDSGRSFVPTTTMFPGGGHAPAEDPRGKLYDGKPEAISEGLRLFDWYNCSGCHFHGAGGMGPALMNPHLHYGSRIDEIHETLVQGRPNGMPSWGGKIPDEQLWQIAAYVRSLGQTPPTEPPPPPATRLPPPPPDDTAPAGIPRPQ